MWLDLIFMMDIDQFRPEPVSSANTEESTSLKIFSHGLFLKWLWTLSETKVVQWKQASSLEFEEKLMETEKTTWSELTKKWIGSADQY